MFSWAKQQLANVAGTQEPIYGPSAIRSVAVEATDTPYTELSRDDFTWKALGGTNVETQTFYLTADSGNSCILQIIHSTVAGIHTTSQFNTKIFYADPSKELLWCSTPLSNVDFSEDRTAIYADNCAVELSEDGNSYTIKSLTDERAIVNIKVTRDCPAFQAGKTGKSLFGTDLENPWGFMHHAFWARCTAEGTITTADGPLDFKGRAFYVYALQGMKPHHAASRWNFLTFHSPELSSMIMQFTTPPSYGSTVVGVGAIVKDGEIITVSCDLEVEHVETQTDSENDWPMPTKFKCAWRGKDKANETVEALLDFDSGPCLDKVDIMAEVPSFVKKIVASTVGTKPYLYHYSPEEPQTLKVSTNGTETSVAGRVYAEASFIS